MSPAETSQQAVIDFLGRPASHGGAPVKRIDTHAAAVFLAGARALKIKRAVRFPFLDYSTLEKAQGRLRSRDRGQPPLRAGDLPRRGGDHARADGALAIGGNGEPVEWAVEMAPLRRDADARPSGRSRADRRRARRRARPRGGARACRAPVVKAAGFADELGEIIAQNDAELRAPPDLFPPAAVRALTRRRDARLRAPAPAARRTRARRRVRRCHGDLHLGNIVLIDGAPVLFDAIEFDPGIATGDVLYDLAFLLMDLIERGLQRRRQYRAQPLSHARRGAPRISTRSPRCRCSCRCGRRSAPRSPRRGARQARERATIEQSARDYFALAGKTAGAAAADAAGGRRAVGHRQVAARPRARARNSSAPGAVVLRSDVERKLCSASPRPSACRRRPTRRDVTAQVYAPLADKARRVLAAGHSAIVDAVFADARRAGGDCASGAGAAFHGLFLTADLSVRLARVGARKGDASDADAAVARAPGAIRSRRRCEWTAVDASGTPEADAAPRQGRRSALHEPSYAPARPAAPPPCPLALRCKIMHSLICGQTSAWPGFLR